ncbi:hypothetical protein C2845_PM02G18850 [Panicum miliaceum]|uniref:GTD-binding domain-containing protein n=1 Tax=Panicum miliaceum TaxID=4540 RepID=A0A3L6S9X1_PANMI|nr:hypothetical protein C2845_PM02G18850 [Panicum miliaceum]
MMLRLQHEKAKVQMELRQFRRFADEKMALDAAEIDQLRTLLAQRAHRLVRLRTRLPEYRLQFLHLSIPLPEGASPTGGYYSELRCDYGDGKEEEEVVALDLVRRICLAMWPSVPSCMQAKEEAGDDAARTCGGHSAAAVEEDAGDDDTRRCGGHNAAVEAGGADTCRRVLPRSVCVLLAASATVAGRHHSASRTGQSMYLAPNCWAHTASLADFGGVGDGTTSNTAAFRSAVDHLSQFSGEGGGGAMPYVPAGKWLTGPFNLTSHLTLFLHSDADISEWPIIDPLPSYKRGRDEIGGQGALWWSKFHKNQLKCTRGHLIEVLWSDTVFISNLTLVSSPAWNIHPVYSSNIVMQGVTILAPTHSPNTDGINPDSCSHVRIEDCYIVSGNDCVAIKSGWDEAYGMRSQQIVVRRLTCVSPTSAVIALGSEMSGGIRDMRIKTAVGWGAYVGDVFVRLMTLETIMWMLWMTAITSPTS